MPDDDDPRYVLLVDGDAGDSAALHEFLKRRGIDSSHARNMAEARELLTLATYDQVVLDDSSEHRAGMQLLTELRHVPEMAVLLVSNLHGAPDMINGLEHGADDYLVKPYDTHVLVARMRAVHRRCRRSLEGWRRRRHVRFDDWSLDLQSRVATHGDGRESEFTPGEFHLLRVFLESGGDVLSRERIAGLTHRDAGQVLVRSIDVLIGRIRRKLEVSPDRAPIIETVRGEGYRLTTGATWT